MRQSYLIPQHATLSEEVKGGGGTDRKACEGKSIIVGSFTNKNASLCSHIMMIGLWWVFSVFQVGYESPHPHMRVPGLPASLQSAASGKP